MAKKSELYRTENPLWSDRAEGTPLGEVFKPAPTGLKDAPAFEQKPLPSQKAKIAGPRIRRTSRPR